MILGRSYGKPYINFGEPIVLQSYADAHMPGWRTTIAEDSESMPESFKSFVSKLALENSRRINAAAVANPRSEEHTSELQSLMRSSYAVLCLNKKNNTHITTKTINNKTNTLIYSH